MYRSRYLPSFPAACKQHWNKEPHLSCKHEQKGNKSYNNLNMVNDYTGQQI
jgi:hypothetical protein